MRTDYTAQGTKTEYINYDSLAEVIKNKLFWYYSRTSKVKIKLQILGFKLKEFLNI